MIMARLELAPFNNKIFDFNQLGQHPLVDSLILARNHSTEFGYVTDVTIKYVYFYYTVKSYYNQDFNKLAAALKYSAKLARKYNISFKITSRAEDCYGYY